MSSDRPSPRPRAAPWVHLPTELTERFLERLPLPDYIRFAAVCKPWRSIQQHHRTRSAPNPPPMLRLPWLIFPEDDDGSIVCYSIFERRSYVLHLPDAPELYHFGRVFSDGWMLLRKKKVSDPRTTIFCLGHLISQARIELPRLNVYRTNGYFAEMSSSPGSPDLAVLVLDEHQLYLFRSGYPGWRIIQSTVQLRRLDEVYVRCVGKKFYCLVGNGSIVILDPRPLSMRTIKMDVRQLSLASGVLDNMHDLAECNGNLLLVEALHPTTENRVLSDVLGFRVFHADLMGRRWKTVEDIGDQMLIYHGIGCFSVLASDVGGRENCILFHNRLYVDWTSKSLVSWRSFDLGAQSLSLMALPDTEVTTHPEGIEESCTTLIMPTIC